MVQRYRLSPSTYILRQAALDDLHILQLTKLGGLLVTVFAIPATRTGPVFRDAAAEAGVDAVVRSGSKDKQYLVELLTGGVCLFDFDNDGNLDICIVNGSNLKAYLTCKKGFSNRLYRNLGNGKFEDVTERAGVGGAEGWSSPTTPRPISFFKTKATVILRKWRSKAASPSTTMAIRRLAWELTLPTTTTTGAST